MEIKLGYAATEDLPALAELWVRCFPPDEESYARWFYRYFLLEERCPAAFVDGRPVCACTLLDGTLWKDGEESPIFYLYALATLPEYRGRGLAGQVLNFAQETAERTGRAGVILLPASNSLFRFYGAHGYETVFQLPYHRVEDLASQGYTLRREPQPEREELYRLYRETMKEFPCAFLKPRLLFDAVLEDTTEEDGGVLHLYSGKAPMGWCLQQGDDLREFYLPKGVQIPPETGHHEAMYRGPCNFQVPGILGPILE